MKEYGIDKKLETNISYLSLGSNLKNKADNIFKATSFIENKIGPIIKSSKLYTTEPWGVKNQNKFINQVLSIETSLSPLDLLNECKNIEKKMGRISSRRWGERLIDIDILYYNDLILNFKKLSIPHPEIANRKFILIPLNDIDPDYVHPILDLTNQELLNETNDNCLVIEYGI